MTGANDQEVGQLVSAVGVAADVRIQIFPKSLGDLQAILDEIATARVPSDLSVNVQENRVDVRTESRSALAAVLSSELLSGGVVHIDEVQSLAGPATNIYGGLGGAENGWSGCPSAFTVRKNGTTTDGILTAGHCGNTISYSGTNLPFQAEWFKDNADAQWHTVPGFTAVPGFIYYPDQSWRWVTSVKVWGDVVVGQLLCKYGPAGGYACGTVDSKYVRPSYIPDATATYVRVKNCNTDMVQVGDSGGPVFYQNAAYGVISGSEDDLFCSLRNMLIFTTSGYATYHFDVSIKVH